MMPVQSFVPLESMEVGHYYKYFNNNGGGIHIKNIVHPFVSNIGILRTNDIFLVIEKCSTNEEFCNEYKILAPNCVGYIEPIIFGETDGNSIHWVEEV